MKTFRNILLTAVLALAGFGSVQAHDFCVYYSDYGYDIFYKILSDNTVAVTFYGDKYSAWGEYYYGNVTVPETVTYDNKTYRVTAIGDDAFRSNHLLESVRLPNSIVEIGKNAFADCHILTEVNLPNTVESIGMCAFENCLKLTSVRIPNRLTKLSNSLFYGCESLESVTIHDRVTSLGNSTFGRCVALKSIHLPEGITEIGYGTFEECSSLAEINLPSGLTLINDMAFGVCTSLRSITIPPTVKRIGQQAFWCCSGLKELVLPDAPVELGSGCFMSSGLESVDLPNSITKVDDNVFAFSMELKEPIYNDHLFVCLPMSFAGEYTIPDNIKKINMGAFQACGGLKRIHFNSKLEEIGSCVFSGCEHLDSVTIPDNIKRIEGATFQGCANLTHIDLPEGLEAIDMGAFYWCERLDSVTIPDRVRYIGSEAFEGCRGMKQITIGKGMERLEYRALGACSGLDKIILKATVPPVCDKYVFFCDNPEYGQISFKDCVLYVPEEALEAYIANDTWVLFDNIVPMAAEPKPPVVLEPCAAPVISIDDGRLVVTCETEGAVCHTTVVCKDQLPHETVSGEEIELTMQYIVRSYASAEGMADSETVEATFVMADDVEGTKGDVNCDGTVDVTDLNVVIDIICGE